MSVSGLLFGLGSCSVHGYGLYDSNKIRKRLNKNAGRVLQADEQGRSMDPTVQPELASSVSDHIKRSYMRAKGATMSIFGSFCNLSNAMINTTMSGLQLAGYSIPNFTNIHPIATKVSSGIAGGGDCVNGSIRALIFFRAVKGWWNTKNPASRGMFKWQAINQGINTFATWGRGASSLVVASGTLDVAVPFLGKVSPGVIGSLAAAAILMASDRFCKKRIEAARQRDPTNPEVCRTALITQVSDKTVANNVRAHVATTNSDPIMAMLAGTNALKKTETQQNKALTQNQIEIVKSDFLPPPVSPEEQGFFPDRVIKIS